MSIINTFDGEGAEIIKRKIMCIRLTISLKQF